MLAFVCLKLMLILEAYAEGHIDGAVGLNWETQLCDQVRRDILTKEQFEALCNDSGIANDTTVIFYGDNNNWFATYALWQFRYYGHDESLPQSDEWRSPEMG